jgi:hypothetical protein
MEEAAAQEWREISAREYELDETKRRKLQEQCYALYFRDPIAGNVINIYTAFTVGKSGVEVLWPDEDASRRWAVWARRNRFSSFSKNLVTMTYLCGEAFVVLFPLGSDGFRPDVRQVFPTEIVRIISSDEDLYDVRGYVRRPPGSLEEYVYAPEDVVHFRINDVGPVLRGRPLLERAMQPLVLYRELIMSHLDLVRMRSHLPVIRYVKGPGSGAPIRALPEPGTVIEAKEGLERWEFPSLNLGGANIEAQARMLGMYIAAAVGLPAYMVLHDVSYGDVGSMRLVESIPLSIFTDMQERFRGFFDELVRRVMPAQYQAEPPQIVFPEVDLRNVREKVERILELYRSHLMSRRTAQIELGLNPDQEAELMQSELTPLARHETLADGLTKAELLRRQVAAGLVAVPPDSTAGKVLGWLEKHDRLGGGAH